MDEIKEHIKLLNKTKQDFFSSNTLNGQVEVDFVIGSQILKNWDHYNLITEDGKIILKKEIAASDKKEKIIEHNEFTIKDNKKEEVKKEFVPEPEENDDKLVDVNLNIEEIKTKVISENKKQKSEKAIDKEEEKINESKETNNIKIDEKKKKSFDNEYDFFNLILSLNKKEIEELLFYVFNKLLIEKDKSFIYNSNDEQLYLNMKLFFSELQNNFIDITNIKVDLNYKFDEKIEVNEDRINFLINLNKKIEFDLFKILELKNKNHIAKKYLFVFHEDEENELLINEYYLTLQDTSKIEEIKNRAAVPEKIFKAYHQINMYLMKKNKKEEKPF